MKNRITYLCFILLLSLSCTSPQQTIQHLESKIDPTSFANKIDEKNLKTQLYTFSSDEFEGRATGTAGEQKAIDFLVNYYKSIGVSALQTNGEYKQLVPIENQSAPKLTIQLQGKSLNNGDGFVSLNTFNNQEIQLVSVGYGIETDSYSDYDNKNVTNKWVVIKNGEPTKSGNYFLNGNGKKSIWSNWKKSHDKRVAIAKSKGAKGILFVDNAAYNQAQSKLKFLKRKRHTRMRLVDTATANFGTVFVRENMAYKMLNQGSFTVENNNENPKSYNVAAIIKGSEKPEEHIILSAHLDHIGIHNNGNVYNGADDDGSGNVALLEIAKAFQEAKNAGKGPKRSIVFLHVTGEEKGLLGSKHYTDNDPLVPLANAIANLNIDMIGRIDPKREGKRNYLYLIGADKLSTELHEISEAVNNKYCNIELDYRYNDKNDPNRFYYRSDHYNFAKNNIPVIFYFNGTHDDYHRHTDTVDKINFDLLENRTKLVFHTAWELANRKERIIVDKAN